MSEQNTRRMLLENLYQLTKLALRQAKIEYVEALNSTLAERETVLATMWGYDPQQGLPEIAPDSKLVKKPEPNAEDNELFEEIRDLDRQLVSVLKHNMNKLNRSEERRVGKECRSRWSPDH